MCLKSVGCFRPIVYHGLLVDLGTKSIGRVSYNLDRLISESLVFAFYIMHIYGSCEIFYKDMIKLALLAVYI